MWRRNSRGNGQKDGIREVNVGSVTEREREKEKGKEEKERGRNREEKMWYVI